MSPPCPGEQAGPDPDDTGATFNLPLQLWDLGREETKDVGYRSPQHKPIGGHAAVTADYDGIIKDGITALKVSIEPLATADTERGRKNEREINICIFRPIYLWVIFPFPFLFDLA